MHSYEDRIWAVELYYRYGKKTSAVVRELGYPSTKQLSRWVRIYEQKDDLPRDLKPRELLDRYIRWYNEKRIKHNCSCCGDNHCDCDRLDRQQRRLLSYVHVQEPYIWPCSVFPLIFWNISAVIVKPDK